MREAVIETIDGKEYEFLQLGARRAFIVLNRLVKLGLPGVAKALTSLNLKSGNLMDAEIDENVLGDAITQLGSGLDENENVKTAEMLFESVTYKGRKVTFETETFQGNLFHMIKVLGKAARVNVGDFFGDAQDAAQRAGISGQGRTTSKTNSSSGDQSSKESRP